MSHQHHWHDVTTIQDVDRKYICSGCDARRTGDDDPDGREVFGTPKNDGWDGMRRFLKQMGEGR